MPADTLVRDLTAALEQVPIIDPHSHIDPLSPAAKSLDDILGYHYYTELAHSVGMSAAPLAKEVPPRDRVRAIVQHMDRYDNTAQYGWFLDIARSFLGFTGARIAASDADKLFDAAEKTFAQKDWAKQVRTKTKLEKIFLNTMPIVPLFIGPRWSTYSTRYFHCFNSPSNFYGDPIFSTYPDNLLSFTRICPGGKAGA